jgi:thiamine biosynthesis lipoprotein
MLISVVALFALVLPACSSHPKSTTIATAPPTTRPAATQPFEYSQLHMGVRTRLVGFAQSQEHAEEACRAAFKRVAELDDMMTDWRPQSELMRLCAKAGGPPVPVSEELFLVLQHAQEIARKSNGAFDVTIGPLIQLWREARKAKTLPTQERLAEAHARVGHQKMKLDAANRTVQLMVRGMKLDLGGIAKGYAADEAIRVLGEHGVTSALCEMGGDIVLGDAPPGRHGWIIEITNDLPGRASRKVILKNCAVSTSGDTEQFVIIDGVRYSHIVNPLTGLGLTDRLLVTIVAKDGLTSDPLSTTVSILGRERRRELAESLGAKAYIREP